MNKRREEIETVLQVFIKITNSQDIEYEIISTIGSTNEECLRIMDEKRPEMVILTKGYQSNLSRFLFGQQVNKLIKKLSCPYEII